MDSAASLDFFKLTYAGLSNGVLLALIAVGLVLVFKATDVINFAHGEFMMLGAYIGLQLLTWLEPVAVSEEIAAVVAVVGMVMVMVAAGVIVERLILRPMIGEPIISVIMVTIGLSNIIQAIIGAIWGKIPTPYPSTVIPDQGKSEIIFAGAGRKPFNLLIIQHSDLIAAGVVVVLIFLLIMFFRRSKQGIAMRATADDQQAAMSMGISIQTIFAITWSLAALTAGFAGMMIADLSNGASGDIPHIGLRAFPVIILGGLDSITGAIIGGVAIGLVEAYASGYIDPTLKSVVPYIVLLGVMMIRPYGLFGQQIIERV